MAAAEARTGWQRRGNCCFVHGDVRSGQRFSRRPSSSSSKESDSAHENASYGIDHVIPDRTPFNSNPELTPSTRWWLNLEPNFGPQKEFIYDQQKSLDAELEVLSSGYINKTAIISDYYQCKEVSSNQSDCEKSGNSILEKPCTVSVTSPKSDPSKRMQELKAGTGDGRQFLNKRDTGEFWYSDDDFMNLDSFSSLDSEQSKKLSPDLDSQWVENEKSEPWWRSTGKDELASLVAQKSLENVENCDLPRPHIKHSRMGPAASTKFPDPNLSFDQITELGLSNVTAYTQGSFTSGHSTYDQDSPLSHNNDSAATHQDEPADERSKAQLLEALCHSQTRARKAEKAAQQAYTEKEHIISLFFKQASQLFAYKQWLHLLQIENFCLQLNKKDGLPWSPYKGRHMKKKKGQRRAGKRSDNSPTYEISKGAVAFALGLGLAGAGLLLGWTMGWLFPAA
ncbi:uncharacterized protein LOC126802356 [Argentina anserina]|uniref:uncharacterized protein LOC126802356 n=1 Tax=Argentina anserina TaxID=57926 RepID=UPI00217690C2|nr:uncharacterized protein LOC126802356 [Potentilla anserina]XP_050385929.1 uncharacterized protein LOC126802356 [Potentilla anserina]